MLISDVKLFNKYENMMRNKHVEDKFQSTEYIRLNQHNKDKQTLQNEAYLKDEDEIKRFLREQKNQWRKESKLKTRGGRLEQANVKDEAQDEKQNEIMQSQDRNHEEHPEVAS